jgi:hypothetical protein
VTTGSDNREREVVIRSAADIAAALGLSLRYDGALVTEENLCGEFFDLRTRVAGDLLQRFANYRARLAINGLPSSSTSTKRIGTYDSLHHAPLLKPGYATTADLSLDGATARAQT